MVHESEADSPGEGNHPSTHPPPRLGPASWHPGALSVEAKVEFSATVFSGAASDWVSYLSTAAEDRYVPGLGVRAYVSPSLRLVVFDPENEDSRWLAELLDQVMRRVRRRAERKPNVQALLEELLFDNELDAATGARVVLSDVLPTTGTRESSSEESSSREARFVLQSRLVHRLRETLEAGSGLSEEEKMGLSWPLATRLIAQIAYPLSARDRFVARIDMSAKLAYLAINLLYDAYDAGRFVPNGASEAFEKWMSETSNVPKEQLFDRHPYFRTVAKLSFVLRALPYASYADEARIAAREYLDPLYLRLGLASAMPDVASAVQAMPLATRWGRLRLPRPSVGRFGIIDQEDEAAWKRVASPFRDIGFVLVRQIGVGDFGRVYEAVNQRNGYLPERVALKVDRIMSRRTQSILEATAAARVGGQLARAPHLVRLYDTGTLRRRGFTYHVLQLIDGDTIDTLIQAPGAEHASTIAPPTARRSERQARAEYERAVRLAGQQREWRKGRAGRPFRYPLSAPMVLDVLTSMLLTVEEVHNLGYSINDLKNDNLMMSRRGQIKGIDLDSFAPIQVPLDKAMDFMFLAASIILFVFNAPSERPHADLAWKELAENEARLRHALTADWPLGEVAVLSAGRVSVAELIELLVDLVQRCHRLVYTQHPDLFAVDIARVISVKRRLRADEFVVD